MISSEKGWDAFWQKQSNSFNNAMKLTTIFFAKKIENVFKINPSHHILDYGAGPGFLAEYFETKSTSVTSADINKYFVDKKKSTKRPSFIHITTDAGANKQIFNRELGEQKFDFISLLSVVQYFKNVAEVAQVVDLLVPYLTEGGKLIIADVISSHTSALSDASSLFFQCIKEGKPITFVRFIFYIIFSDYRKHRMQRRLLTLEEKDIQEIASKRALNFEKFDGLTIHSGRTSYVLTKKRH
jgi:2-polyprenyl-3-methyl-5-hydroxy-6-metoxy-1,4-benzoquinol methylase